MGARDALQDTQQEVVQALARLTRADLHVPDLYGGCFSRGHVVSLRY